MPPLDLWRMPSLRAIHEQRDALSSELLGGPSISSDHASALQLSAPSILRPEASATGTGWEIARDVHEIRGCDHGIRNALALFGNPPDRECRRGHPGIRKRCLFWKLTASVGVVSPAFGKVAFFGS